MAEQRHSNEISSGAAMDIEQVTRICRAMILEWGMSEKLGFVRYAPLESNEFGFGEKAYSDDTAKIIDEEVRRLCEDAYADALKLLNENWDKIEAVAQGLLKHETLDAEEVAKLCRGEKLDKPTLSGLLADELPPAPRIAKPVVQPPTPELPPGGLTGGTLPHPG
jgi:cell division protease FtsH